MPKVLRPGRLALLAALLGGPAPAQTPGLDDPPRPLPAGKQDDAQELSRRARALYGAGLWEQSRDRLLEAARLLEEAARLDSESAAPRKALLPLYLALGRLPELEETGRKVLEADPADAESRQLLAGHYRDQGRYSDAAKILAEGLTAGREPPPATRLRMWREVARLRRLAEDQAGAVTAWREALTVLQKDRAGLLDAGFSAEAVADQTLEAAEELGQACLAVRQFHEALTAFAEAARLCEAQPRLRESPAAGRVDWHLAELRHAEGQHADALKAIDRFLALRPQQVPAYELKVAILSSLGRGDDVLPALREHARADPHFVGLHLLLARKAADAGEAREAEAIYRKLLVTNPRPDIYRGLFRLWQSRRQAAQVFELLDETLAAVGDKDKGESDRSDAATRARAMLVVLRSDADLLSEVLPLALERKGDRDDEKRTWETFKVLGSLAARARQTKAAEDLFRAYLRGRGPRREPDVDVYSALIELLREQRRHGEIAELCRDALRDRRFLSHAYFRFHLGLALIELDEDDAAVRELDRAIEQAVDDRAKQVFRSSRVEVLSKAGRADAAVEEAKAMLKDARDPSQRRSARLALSQAYLAQKKYPESEEQLRLILADDPDDATVLNALGYELADQNRKLGEAERLIRRAVELDRSARREAPEDEGDSAAFLDSLGWVLFRRGQPTEARDWLEKAYALPAGRHDPTVAEHLGDVYFRLNDPASAKLYWKEAAAGYARDKAARRDGRPAEVTRKLRQAEAGERPAP